MVSRRTLWQWAIFSLLGANLLGLLPLSTLAQPGLPPPPVLPPDRGNGSVMPSLPSTQGAIATPPNCPAIPNPALKLPSPSAYESLLKRTWKAYGDRFIHPDGYVIDYKAEDQRTTSEGQAYAMLRAVIINDQATFDRTLAWAEVNLDRPTDSLWSWHWNTASGIQDPHFATDSDVDAITALIFAARRWNCPAYEALAKQKLGDLWRLAIADIQGKQFLLPGDRAAFQKPNQVVVNPSYFAPYAYRLFAQVDPNRNWNRLVGDGYQLLEDMTAFSSAGLPADWIAFNPQTEQFEPLPADRRIQSIYSFDAFRVWWRVGLDANWNNSARAKAYLKQYLPGLAQRWREEQAIAAVISLDGEALVDYEGTAQYAMLYPVMKLVDRTAAFEIFKEKLLGSYSKGVWDDKNAYYTNNLAWFALLPPQGPQKLLFPIDKR